MLQTSFRYQGLLVNVEIIKLFQVTSYISVNAWKNAFRTLFEVFDCYQWTTAVVIIQKLPHCRWKLTVVFSLFYLHAGIIIVNILLGVSPFDNVISDVCIVYLSWQATFTFDISCPLVHPLLINNVKDHRPIWLCYPTFVRLKREIHFCFVFPSFVFTHCDQSGVHLARFNRKFKFEANILHDVLGGKLVLGFAISPTKFPPVVGALQGTQVIWTLI